MSYLLSKDGKNLVNRRNHPNHPTLTPQQTSSRTLRGRPRLGSTRRLSPRGRKAYAPERRAVLSLATAKRASQHANAWHEDCLRRRIHAHLAQSGLQFGLMRKFRHLASPAPGKRTTICGRRSCFMEGSLFLSREDCLRRHIHAHPGGEWAPASNHL